MTALELAIRLIRVFEGYKSYAYRDAGGVWTIGWGHTTNVQLTDTCDITQAEAWLAADIAPLAALVENLPPTRAAALISFGYNCGIGALRRILTDSLVVRPDGFYTSDGIRYGVKSGGLVLEGLKARRALEAALYLIETPHDTNT